MSLTISRAIRENIARVASPVSSRIGCVDDAKGIGIILVVFGHVWRGLFKAGLPIPESGFNFVDQWIYAFHMPLFFLLSGLFIARSAQKPAGRFVLDKLDTLIYPYFIWTILQWVATKASGSGANSPATINDLWLSPIQPYLHLWFLYVLFLSSLIALVIFKARGGAIGMVIFAIIFACVHVNTDFWPVFYELQIYLPFFALGALVSKLLLNKLHELSAEALIAIAGISGTVLTLCIRAEFFHNDTLRLIPALAGIGMILAFAAMVDQTSMKATKFLGALSLPIYLAHVIAAGATRVLLLNMLHIHEVRTHLIAGTIIGIAAPVALTLFMQRMNFPYLFTVRKMGKRGSMVQRTTFNEARHFASTAAGQNPAQTSGLFPDPR